MYFDPEFIEYLKHSVSLLEVVTASGYQTRGSGKHKGISSCPNCGRDWTHIKINTYKNLFRCNSPTCHFGGNQFQWLMKTEGVSFVEAVKRVAEIGNIALPATSEADKYRNKKKLICLQLAAEYYARFHHSYLIEKRRISEHVVNDKKRMIGFAEGGTGLKDYLNSKGYDDEMLTEIGLIRLVGNQYYDLFYQQVIIPTFEKGFVVALYGRAVNPLASRIHTVLNDGYMDGLDEIDSKKPVIIVESRINRLTLLSHGYHNVIAMGGAGKLKSIHAYKLKQLGVRQIYIGYDTGDSNGAGRIAALETGELFLEVSQDFKVRVIEMPTDTDINEFFFSRNDFDLLLAAAPSYAKFAAFEQLKQIPRELIVEFLQNGGPDDLISTLPYQQIKGTN